MGAVKAKEIPTEAAFMAEFWKLVKQFWNTEESDDYWESLISATHELYENHKTPFCLNMIVAYSDYLEKEAMEQRRRNEV